MGKLGEGGGGCVYLAKNKIDENIYAIKKIKLDPTISKKVMKEVKFLSKLSHKHIVRYYQVKYNQKSSLINKLLGMDRGYKSYI